MKNTKLILACAAVLIGSVFAATAQKVTIDLRFNALAEDSANYFNWAADGKAVKDGYDAATGASKAQSTTAFNAVRYDSETSKKAAIPAGLRSLVLYPVADRGTAEYDAFTVIENGKQLTIRFVHRGTAYQIVTDAKGKIDMGSSFSMAGGLADNVAGKFIIKADYLKDGGDAANMADLDWSKVTLAADTAAADASRSFTGTLTAAYKKGILTVKGSLNQK
ncbi:hypothetical protein [Treponema brennaborense]|uniref:Uncharacterized protein n=1 Tax=Treponema brennaborense (strain DSM 12168 / CIP 105900 / DD5/3) TaxID=906968 RepID=F4LJ01_TREBD|nr:hypothetical protein [Treponema brennaborense]AEE17310.1 hypothetical protein Trebr_1891 [Treponema brennaborense DSM 12168]